MRKAKKEADERELIKMVVDGTSFDDVPTCVCPIPYLASSMTTIFCATKCYQPCDYFTEFTFITDRCNDLNCFHDAPCATCLDKISEYKIILRGIKATFHRRGWPARVKKRCKDYCAKKNKIYNVLKERREARGK